MKSTFFFCGSSLFHKKAAGNNCQHKHCLFFAVRSSFLLLQCKCHFHHFSDAFCMISVTPACILKLVALGSVPICFLCLKFVRLIWFNLEQKKKGVRVGSSVVLPVVSRI